MEQRDPFGVIPQGAFTSDDVSDLAVRLVAKDAYIARLQRRIAELTPPPTPAGDAPEVEERAKRDVTA